MKFKTKACGEWQNLTPATHKPLNQLSTKFAQVIPTNLLNSIQNRISGFVSTHVPVCKPRSLLCYFGVLHLTHSQDATTDIDT